MKRATVDLMSNATAESDAELTAESAETLPCWDGAVLVAGREALGWSQARLAREAGLSGGRAHVWKLERGVLWPTRRTHEKLAAALERGREVMEGGEDASSKS